MQLLSEMTQYKVVIILEMPQSLMEEVLLLPEKPTKLLKNTKLKRQHLQQVNKYTGAKILTISVCPLLSIVLTQVVMELRR